MDEAFETAAGIHRVLGDPTRLAMCWLLAEGEPSVTELAEELGISQSLCSQHLRILKGAGLAEGRRDSYWIRYRLLPQPLELINEEVELLLEAVPPRKRPRR